MANPILTLVPSMSSKKSETSNNDFSNAIMLICSWGYIHTDITYIQTHAYIQTDRQAYIHTYITYITYIHTHAYIHNIHMHTYITYIHTYIHNVM